MTDRRVESVQPAAASARRRRRRSTVRGSGAGPSSARRRASRSVLHHLAQQVPQVFARRVRPHVAARVRDLVLLQFHERVLEGVSVSGVMKLAAAP